MLKRINKIKPLILLVLIIMLLLTSVSGTIAWLKSESNSLVDRFTYGNIKISLEESKQDNKNYEISPGKVIKKDTTVTVEGGSEDCWLFIKIDKTQNFDTFMTYSLKDDWKALDGYSDIYYREVQESDEKQEFQIIKDNVINVKSELTKVVFDSLNEDTYPTISLSAYAIQRNDDIEGLDTAHTAWLLVNNQK